MTSEPMSKDEFWAKYRPLLIALLADMWCIRKMSPSGVGMEMDRQGNVIKNLLGEMWDDLNPASIPFPQKSAVTPTNGVIQRKAP